MCRNIPHVETCTNLTQTNKILQHTSGKGLWRGDDESDETFNSANYIHVLDELSKDDIHHTHEYNEAMAHKK